jgi:copper(I)-binding protein
MIMLRKAVRPGSEPSRARWNRRARAATAGLALVAVAALSGCAAEAEAGPPTIELVNAYVGVPHSSDPTDAYVVIRNNGNADKLIAVRTSVGGTVTMLGPVRGQTDVMRSLKAIPIAGHTLIRLNPDSYHLVIADTRPMKAGTEINLTLVFAHAGSYQIGAEVTNPQTGGASYFLN